MFLTHEQNVTKRYFFFSHGSNCTSKNEFVFQYTCLQPQFSLSNIKNENEINNNYHVPHTHISNRKRS